jgi:hypothetical protein
MEMLQNSKQSPILHVESITPAHIMGGYISQQVNQKTLKPLSPAGYGEKRMAVFHLFHCHNGKGPSHAFQDEMTALSVQRIFQNCKQEKNEGKKTTWTS